MAKILVGIATVEPDQRFLESLLPFFRGVSKDHQFDCHWIFNKPLEDAQNEMGKKTLEGNYDYLLTLEDDHYDFTPEMLEALLKADAQVIGISYHSRHYPFQKVPMDFKYVDAEGSRRFIEEKFTEGIHETDLVGFGFTLIKREVFEILDYPWFVVNSKEHLGCGPRATDMQFGYRLQQKGVKLMGCWDYTLPHRDITKEEWKKFVIKMIPKKASLFTHMKNGGIPSDANLKDISR